MVFEQLVPVLIAFPERPAPRRAERKRSQADASRRRKARPQRSGSSTASPPTASRPAPCRPSTAWPRTRSPWPSRRSAGRRGSTPSSASPSSAPARPSPPRRTLPTPSASSPAARRCRTTRSASWTTPGARWASARRGGWNSRGRPPPTATSATRRPRRSWSTAIGGTRGTVPTWRRERSTSPAGSRTSSSAPAATSIHRSWRGRWERSRASARGAWPCSAAPIRPPARSGWW